MQAGETWGQEYQHNASEGNTAAKLLNVGTWRPSDGPTLVDELFPHVAHGFRGKTLPFVSLHVSKDDTLPCNVKKDLFLLIIENTYITRCFCAVLYQSTEMDAPENLINVLQIVFRKWQCAYYCARKIFIVIEVTNLNLN